MWSRCQKQSPRTKDTSRFRRLGCCRNSSIKTVISDPHRAQRRFDKLSSADQQTLARAKRSASSKYGKRLLSKRGQHIERSFAHVLDAGGMRRATLRGLDNLSKRHQIAAASYNLSQLLRHLHGVGTPKQWVALLFGVIIHLLRSLLRRWQALVSPEHHLSSINPHHQASLSAAPAGANRRSSTARFAASQAQNPQRTKQCKNLVVIRQRDR